MDEAETLVEAAIDHQCPGKEKSKTFRVRFVGCGPDEDVWLPFAETNPLSALDKLFTPSSAWLKKGNVADPDWQLAS
jgi:hypothetical protein